MSDPADPADSSPAAKRAHEEHACPSGAGAGRGTGRPGGVAEVLAVIQRQLAIQTGQMKLLADKTDVRAIADKVDALKTSVDVNTSDIVDVRRAHEDEKVRVDRRLADLELKVQQLSEGNSSSSFFDKNQFQREKYLSLIHI